MKILFDQNISYRIVSKVKDVFSDCSQVRELKLENKGDKEIWEFAKKENYTIVTFDSDFYDLSTLFGHPPKVIWLRTGNTNSENLITLLQDHSNLIKDFITNKNYSQIACLEIH